MLGKNECADFQRVHTTINTYLATGRPGFDSRHYQKKKVVGLERGPLSLVSTIEELLDIKVAAHF
jgi:hypothetical protein